jgi:hypothetical protein
LFYYGVFMRVLNEVQTDSVGGGIQFVAYADQIMAARDWIASAGGGWITSGSYFSSGSSSSGSSSSSGGYGENMVNAAKCKADVESAAIIGAGIGGAIGAYFGKNVPALGLGAIVGAGLGGFYGLKTSPNCAPK